MWDMPLDQPQFHRLPPPPNPNGRYIKTQTDAYPRKAQPAHSLRFSREPPFIHRCPVTSVRNAWGPQNMPLLG